MGGPASPVGGSQWCLGVSLAPAQSLVHLVSHALTCMVPCATMVALTGALCKWGVLTSCTLKLTLTVVVLLCGLGTQVLQPLAVLVGVGWGLGASVTATAVPAAAKQGVPLLWCAGLCPLTCQQV